jgi:hypothetical protein
VGDRVRSVRELFHNLTEDFLLELLPRNPSSVQLGHGRIGALTTPSGGETFRSKEFGGKRCAYQLRLLLLSRPARYSRDAPKVRKGLKGNKGLLDRKGPKANKVPRGLKGLKANRVARGRKDLKAQKANRVPLVKQDPVQQAYVRSSRIGVIRAPIATSNAARAKSWFL